MCDRWPLTNQPPASVLENPLLLLPAAGDNAAMRTEPPKADPPKRKRRWFQFSLRSVMIVTAVFGRRSHRPDICVKLAPLPE
jgi:hypothetical protein